MNSNNTLTSEGVNQLSLQKAALYYSKYARVFPLAPNTKIPLLPGSWTAYATQDPMTIIQWWTANPNANIALVADTNLTIIDLDIKDGKDGVTSFRELIAELNIEIPKDIPIVTTTSGGKHVFYKHPNDQHPGAFHNGTNKGSRGGIDVRSGNAYVVASPSVVDGNQYLWASAGSTPLDELPTLPEQLITTLDEWGISNVIDISKDQPELLEEAPRHDEHPISNLPQHLLEFALHGTATNYGGDGSAALMGLASRLYILGLTDAEVLTFLAFYPGPSNVAFKRRHGSFESAVSWLWKYSCIKARKNRKMSGEEAAQTFLAAIPSPQADTGIPVSEAPDLSGIESIEDFGIARDFIKHALSLPPLEQGVAITELKDSVKWLGINARAIDQEIKEQDKVLRAEGSTTMMGGPVFNHLSDTGAVRETTENFHAILAHHGIKVSHNTMSHDYDLYIPGSSEWFMDTMANDQRTMLRDLMAKYGMPMNRVDEYVSYIGGQNAYHPVERMLNGIDWDGEDRLTPVLECLQLNDPDATLMRDKLVTTWLMSALAVIGDYGNNPPRGVLVLAGPQHCGKTSFFRTISPPFTFGEGLHLDVHNKDSLVQSVKYWIVELGELDATFKKSDIAALKAHISNTSDEIRLPYAVKANKWQRRTVYGATVNRVDFLQDYTGNTRFWPVEVTGVDLPVLEKLMAGTGQAQFWAQLSEMHKSGHPYLLTAKEVKKLEDHNSDFREVRAEEEQLRAVFDFSETCCIPMTSREIAAHCGMRTDIKGRNPLTEPLQYLTGQTRSISMRRGKGTSPDRCWMMPPLKATH
jgi:putative DNA primase/helicase